MIALNQEKIVSRSLFFQIRVIRALVLRDIISRFGRGNIGFVWIIVEPMLLCSGVLVLWTAMKPPLEHGVPVAALVLTGYMPLTLWRHLGTVGLAILRRNMSLMYHARLTAMDIYIAKVFTEILATTGASIVIFLVLHVAGQIEMPVDAKWVMIGWLLMALYSASTGLIIGALSEYSEIVEKFMQPFMYLTLPLSGCFFLLDWTPSNFREAILYFPLPHGYELIRGGFLGDGFTTYGQPYYLLCWSVAQFGIGVYLLQRVRARVSFA